MQSIPIISRSCRPASLDSRHVVSTGGESIALMHEAPALLMSRIVAESRNTASQPLPARHQILARAGRLFAEAAFEGRSRKDYCRDAAASSGLPMCVFRRALAYYASALDEIGSIVASQRPRDAQPIDGAAVQGLSRHAIWVPRGRVLAVIAPGNHPEAHMAWLQALAFGYNVVLKPSRKDVFTPLRLVHALLSAGLAPGEICFAAGDHHAGEALVEAADLALVYGGAEAVRAFGGNHRVLVRGPGRTKILVRADQPLSAERIEFLVRCVASDGGTRCTNASAVLVEGDHEEVAVVLARALARIPSMPRESGGAALPVFPRAEAEAVRAAFDTARGGAPDLCRRFDTGPAVLPVSEQTAVLRPAVVAVASAEAPGFSSEFPFPCVWVARWRPQDGIAPLRGSLVLTVLADDPGLVEEALREPSIRKVFFGEVPTFYSATGLPHDGALADFLFETKGFATAAVGIGNA